MEIISLEEAENLNEEELKNLETLLGKINTELRKNYVPGKPYRFVVPSTLVPRPRVEHYLKKEFSESDWDLEISYGKEDTEVSYIIHPCKRDFE